MCSAAQGERVESDACCSESKVCGRGVVSHLTSTTLMKPKQRGRRGAGKNCSYSLLGEVLGKRNERKSWPPVNTPQFPLMFVQMLTPINRWHITFCFISCFAAHFQKRWRRAARITWEYVCFCACENRHVRLALILAALQDLTSLYTMEHLWACSTPPSELLQI